MAKFGLSGKKTTHTTMKNDTPRTEAEKIKQQLMGLDILNYLPDMAVVWWVPSEFARQLERELNESHAREAQLRAALQIIHREHLWGSQERAQDICAKALTLPAPPVVPVEDVKPLVAVLRYIRDETDQYADGAPDASAHDKLCLELCHRIQPALATFTVKHPNL